MSAVMEEEIERWTARHKSALVLEIIQGKTTVAEASRAFGITPSEIEDWVDQGKAGMENALRAKPEDVREQYERQLKDLQEVARAHRPVDPIRGASGSKLRWPRTPDRGRHRRCAADSDNKGRSERRSKDRLSQRRRAVGRLREIREARSRGKRLSRARATRRYREVENRHCACQHIRAHLEAPPIAKGSGNAPPGLSSAIEHRHLRPLCQSGGTCTSACLYSDVNARTNVSSRARRSGIGAIARARQVNGSSRHRMRR